MKELPYLTFALITGCALNYNTGLKSPRGSPFRQLRHLHPQLEFALNNKRKALLEIRGQLSEYRLPDYFLKTVKQIETSE